MDKEADLSQKSLGMRIHADLGCYLGGETRSAREAMRKALGQRAPFSVWYDADRRGVNTGGETVSKLLKFNADVPNRSPTCASVRQTIKTKSRYSARGAALGLLLPDLARGRSAPGYEVH
jgi:hypothetical protein